MAADVGIRVLSMGFEGLGTKKSRKSERYQKMKPLIVSMTNGCLQVS